MVRGTVTNIAEFGAFIDLGGLDGLLHITDMSWGRVNHPSEIVKIGDEIEVKILNIDRDREKIALGLKQKEASPWEEIEQKYPVNARVKGAVVSLMSYGAFVRLEDGIEGLVHVSEMSWTRRINHPSEVVNVGDEVDVVILEIDKEKLEISLGMKQTEVNPWELVAEKYPPGTIIEGKVRRQAAGNVEDLFVQSAASRYQGVEGAPAPLSPDTPGVEGEVAQGEIHSLKNGYGFIKYPPNNLFFHYTSVVEGDFSELQEGDPVEFTFAKNEDGQPIAKSVRLMVGEDSGF